jgi:outer membrane protein
MKGTSLIVSVVLFVLVAVLYILHFTGTGIKTNDSKQAVNSGSADGPKIAYVKADSVILNYKLAEDLHDVFTKQQETYSSEYANKRRSFEKDAVAFQEKLQRGGFLTEDRAVQERNRLAGVEQEILRMDQELTGKLGEMQTANSQQVLDSLMNTIKRFNADKKYDYILNSSGVLYGNEGHNVTAEILKLMNDKYLASKPK